MNVDPRDESRPSPPWADSKRTGRIPGSPPPGGGGKRTGRTEVSPRYLFPSLVEQSPSSPRKEVTEGNFCSPLFISTSRRCGSLIAGKVSSPSPREILGFPLRAEAGGRRACSLEFRVARTAVSRRVCSNRPRSACRSAARSGTLFALAVLSCDDHRHVLHRRDAVSRCRGCRSVSEPSIFSDCARRAVLELAAAARP